MSDLERLKLINEDIENSEISDEDLLYMLDNIGNEDPEIRDELIYHLFAQLIVWEKLSKEQIDLILEYINVKRLLFYKIEHKDVHATLVRSFASLLLSLLIEFDGNSDSIYYHYISEEQIDELFNDSLNYCVKELDYTGYHDEYGWVHAIAHAADLLLSFAKHDFIKEKDDVDQILLAIKDIFYRQYRVFDAGEDKRLALVVISLYKRKKISHEDLFEWILSFDFNNDSLNDFYINENIFNFLNMINLYITNQNSDISKSVYQMNDFDEYI